jgi:putative transferase (TIGR04331 family)
MFLATTANTDFWDKENELLFLGSWCSKKPTFSTENKLRGHYVPYHWEHRSDFLQAAKTVNNTYELFLPRLTEALNDAHGQDNSVEYWRIVVGPWLYYFVGVCFDRFLSIEAARQCPGITNTWVPFIEQQESVPTDFASFQHSLDQDNYNLLLYSKIIRFFGQIPYETKVVQDFSITPIKPNPKHTSNVSRKFFQPIYLQYLRRVAYRRNRYFFANLGWSRKDLVRIQLSLGDLPNLHVAQIQDVETHKWKDHRDNLSITLPHRGDNFQELLCRLIPDQIPRSYVEGYRDLENHAECWYPKGVKIIVSATQHFTCDLFKIWSAKKIAEQAVLIGMPHGGHYGNALWSANEIHERKVSHIYATWGWEDSADPKAIPMPSGLLEKRKDVIKSGQNKGILWVGLSRPRYFHWMISAPQAPNMKQYLLDQITFFGKLNPATRKQITLRTFHTDYGLDIKSILQGQYPDLTFCSSQQDMNHDLRKNQLCVISYNGTPLLEAMASDYPVLGFWDPSHWELRDSAKPFFDMMVETGILFYDAAEAAEKLNQISDDPRLWWNDEQVVKARKYFCNQFALTGRRWQMSWNDLLASL